MIEHAPAAFLYPAQAVHEVGEVADGLGGFTLVLSHPARVPAARPAGGAFCKP